MGSVRDYAALWLGAVRGVGGNTALGGNALLTTAQHKLDGIEHLTADDTDRLDATVDAHGLMPKLSGDAGDVFHGDGSQAPVTAEQVTYDNATSGLTADDVQAAIDELVGVGSLPWFDVMDYGAVHDGVTDDTPAIQDAIDACMAAGGGTVFFPNGIYLIDGALQSTSTYNSQLTIPQHAYSGGGDTTPPIAIAFVGMGPAGQWNHGTSGPWDPGTSGAILLSTWAGTISDYPAVIAAGRYDAQYPAASFNWIEVTFRNIEIRTPPDPKLSGIQMAAIASLTLENTTVSTNTDSVAMGLPSHANAFGVHCPLIINVNPPGIFYNAFIDGFYYGVLVSEVFHGINLSIHHCRVGIYAIGAQNHGWSIDRVFFVAVQNPLYIAGGEVHFNIANWFEEYSTGGTFARTYSVDDASNYGYGFISHHIQLNGAGGGGQALAVNGGAHISFHWIKGKEWILNNVIGIPTGTDPSTNPATGGKLYARSSDGHPTWRDSAGTVTDLLAASPLTLKDEGTPLATAAASIDFAGAGVTASGATGAKTVTIPGTPTGAAGGALSGTYPNPSVVDDSHNHTASTVPTAAHILLADGHATPFAFTDLLQADDGSDFLWTD